MVTTEYADAVPPAILESSVAGDEASLSGGLDHTAIAEGLGLSADVVRSHLRRSLLGLRDRLAVVRDAH